MCSGSEAGSYSRPIDGPGAHLWLATAHSAMLFGPCTQVNFRHFFFFFITLEPRVE